MRRTLALALWWLSLASMATALSDNEVKTPMDAASNVDALVAAEDEESAAVEKRSAWPDDKRGWNDLPGVWGKRGWKDLQGVWGKREGNWNNLKGLWGKREGNWNNLKGLWGKRAEGDWNNLRGVWGKRADGNWNNLKGLWGKRSRGQDWNALKGVWGKRSIRDSDEDSSFDAAMDGYEAGN